MVHYRFTTTAREGTVMYYTNKALRKRREANEDCLCQLCGCGTKFLAIFSFALILIMLTAGICFMLYRGTVIAAPLTGIALLKGFALYGMAIILGAKWYSMFKGLLECIRFCRDT